MLELIDRIVFSLPWVRRKHEQEIEAWAAYGAAMVEAHTANLPREYQVLIRQAYVDGIDRRYRVSLRKDSQP